MYTLVKLLEILFVVGVAFFVIGVILALVIYISDRDGGGGGGNDGGFFGGGGFD